MSKKRKVGFSWRKLVRSNKAQKSIKSFLTYSFLILISVFFLGGIFIYRTFTKSVVNAESSTSFDINNREVVTLAIVSVDNISQRPLKTKSISYLIFDKTKEKVITYEIDINSKTDVVGKFGEEPYANILSLGMMNDDKVSSGAELLLNTIKRDFAFNVDKYLIVDYSVAQPIIDTFTYGKGSSLLDLEILREMLSSNTNLMFSELYHLFSFSRSLRSDRFIVNSSFDIVSNKNNVDETLRDITFDTKISEEKTSVGILNGTDISGVAGFASRVVLNNGGYVIAAENAAEKHAESMIVVTSTDFGVINQVQSFFGIEKVILSSEAGLNEGIIDRVDVTVVLGFDISERL